jgi:NADH-quinone oxidoreductase subunit L
MYVSANLIWLAVALPLAGFLINGALSIWRPGAKTAVSIVGPAVLLGAFAVVVLIFRSFAAANLGTPQVVPLWTWLPVGALRIELSLLVDQLSLVMLLVVTGVGSLIHLFSVGYMRSDPGYARYFAYLNLFVVFMLMLVLGSSLPVLFIGW